MKRNPTRTLTTTSGTSGTSGTRRRVIRICVIATLATGLLTLIIVLTRPTPDPTVAWRSAADSACARYAATPMTTGLIELPDFTAVLTRAANPGGVDPSTRHDMLVAGYSGSALDALVGELTRLGRPARLDPDYLTLMTGSMSAVGRALADTSVVLRDDIDGRADAETTEQVRMEVLTAAGTAIPTWILAAGRLVLPSCRALAIPPSGARGGRNRPTRW